jgi:hypothetical protein
MMTVIHVVFGSFALFAAPAALFVSKGGGWHKRLGFAFGIAMGVVLFTAGFMWQSKGHFFLVPLGIVSGYLVINGYRVAQRRRRSRPSRLQDGIDVAAALVVIGAGIGAARLGITASTPLLHSIEPALIGIGTIAIAFGLNDILGFLGPRIRLGWLFAHFAALIAAYVSAVTAFVVINAHGVPMVLRWLVPSLIGVVAIGTYTFRFASRGVPVAVATSRLNRFRIQFKKLMFGWKIRSGRTL